MGDYRRMKQPYKLKDGSIVPGCTTICNMLDKPQLINWAWKLGKEGKDWREERDSAGDVGTVVHGMIMNFLKNKDFDLADYEPLYCFETARKCFCKFLGWFTYDMETIMVEQPLVSEKLQFGGQPDSLIKIIRKNRLVDIKTSNGIYESHWLQLAGYDILLRENGYKVDEYQILWLPKDNRFDDPIRTDLRREKRIFKYLLSIYKERKANEPPW